MSLPVVAKLLGRSKEIIGKYSNLFDEDEAVLSFNKVTGYSVNFPIFGTCRPTKVCASRCYYAKGGPSWPAALKKQQRMVNSVKHDPKAIAERIIKECSKKKVTFLRWNGGRDLFPESIEALHFVAEGLPTLPIWVVTRIPEMAAKVKNYSNVFVHFSLDRASLDRKTKWKVYQNLPKTCFSLTSAIKMKCPSEKILMACPFYFLTSTSHMENGGG